MLGTDEFIKNAVEDMKKKIPGKAIIACSGGVDSMVSAALATLAVGDRLLAVYVDTGLMRKGETEEVRGMLQDMRINFKIIDAAEEFFNDDDGEEAAHHGLPDRHGDRQVVGEQHARDDAGEGSGEHDPGDGDPPRHTEGVGGLTQFVGDELEHLLGRAHDDRDHE